MAQNDMEQKINTLFEKFDDLSKRFNQFDKDLTSVYAVVQNEIKHLTSELAQLREEQRIQQNQLHVMAEASNEERYKLKEQLGRDIVSMGVKLSDEVIIAEDSAIKKCQSYTNRGVSIAVGTVVLLFGLIETIYYITQIVPLIGGHPH